MSRVGSWLAAVALVFGGSRVAAEGAPGKPGDDRARCQAGDAAACLAAGKAALAGKRSKKTLAAAAQLYERACELGATRGCTEAGVSYFVGTGVPEDKARAERLHKKGCELGDWGCCASWAQSVKNGYASPPDAAAAAAAYARVLAVVSASCHAKDANACIELGVLHRDGAPGIPANEATALDIFLEQCAAKEAVGCRYAGLILVEHDAAKDRRRGKALLTKACKLGESEACNDD